MIFTCIQKDNMKYQFAVLLISVFVVNVLCTPASRIEDELLSLITRIKHTEATRHHDPNSDEKTNDDSKHINLKGQTVHATRSMDLQSRSTGSTLTAAERDNILNLHNGARKSVSPPASDMKTMVGFNNVFFNNIIILSATIKYLFLLFRMKRFSEPQFFLTNLKYSEMIFFCILYINHNSITLSIYIIIKDEEWFYLPSYEHTLNMLLHCLCWCWYSLCDRMWSSRVEANLHRIYFIDC